MRRFNLSDQALILQGDCLEQYADLPPVDFVFTDPPFGHDNNTKGDLIQRSRAALTRSSAEVSVEGRPILSDDFETANQLFTEALAQWKKILPTGAYCCCCCGGGGGHKGLQFARWSQQMADALEFEQAIVWDKGPIGMGWHYRRSYEFVMVAKQPGSPRWFDTTSRVENIIRPGDYGIRKIIPTAGQHPTEKPPELAAHFIRLHTQPGDVVLDPFMGSGSTGVAALQLGRRFVGIELDEYWVRRTQQRLEHVLKHGRDAKPPVKQKAKTTKQIVSPGLWGNRRS